MFTLNGDQVLSVKTVLGGINPEAGLVILCAYEKICRHKITKPSGVFSIHHCLHRSDVFIHKKWGTLEKL